MNFQNTGQWDIHFEIILNVSRGIGVDSIVQIRHRSCEGWKG
jgi:hypothetical protein